MTVLRTSNDKFFAIIINKQEAESIRFRQRAHMNEDQRRIAHNRKFTAYVYVNDKCCYQRRVELAEF